MGAVSVRLLGSALVAAATTLALVKVSPVAAAVIALVPIATALAPSIIRSAGIVLFSLAFVLPYAGLRVFGDPIPAGGAAVYPQDIVLFLVLVFAGVRHLSQRPDQAGFRLENLGVVVIPYALFAAVMLAGSLRGHFAYGTSLVGQPVRMFAYGGIVLALAGVGIDRLFRTIVAVVYGGTIVTMFWAAYYVGTGASQSESGELSTGGMRPLAITTSTFAAAALFLALLSLRLSPDRSRNLLHLAMAILGFVGVALGFGRAVYAAVAVVVIVLFALSRSLWGQVARILPLAVPFIAVAALMVPFAAPGVVTTVVDRVTARPTDDANVRWREANSKVVIEQFREEPVFGVGFGRDARFYFDVVDSVGFRLPIPVDTGQDPHNGYLYLLAGGGVLALAAFLTLLAALAREARRRFRACTDERGKILIAWSWATAFVMLFNAASGTTFGNPSALLGIWALLVLPLAIGTGGPGTRTGEPEGAEPSAS